MQSFCPLKKNNNNNKKKKKKKKKEEKKKKKKQHQKKKKEQCSKMNKGDLSNLSPAFHSKEMLLKLDRKVIKSKETKVI